MTDTTHLSDLFNPGQLDEMIAAKMVRQFEHDNGDLIGYDYTQRAQWEREWNPVTLQCRGLITDTSGRVIARPFAKFFNLSEDLEAVATRFGQGFRCYEKLDGSLGIHYRWEGVDAIATRGSFHSPQAARGTELIDEYGPIDSPSTITHLFEIIYPENRVVVDYGDRVGLVHLGALDIATGKPVEFYWPLSRRAKTYEVPRGTRADEIAELWSHLDDGNFEGFVLVFDDGHRVKVKLDEYVRLHRIMSTTSNRSIWEAMKAGSDLSQVFDAVPDEFYSWAKQKSEELRSDYGAMESSAETEFSSIRHLIDPNDRKPFAMAAKQSDLAPLLFSMLDGKDYSSHIWKRLRPEEIEYPPIGGAGAQADVAG